MIVSPPYGKRGALFAVTAARQAGWQAGLSPSDLARLFSAQTFGLMIFVLVIGASMQSTYFSIRMMLMLIIILITITLMIIVNIITIRITFFQSGSPAVHPCRLAGSSFSPAGSSFSPAGWQTADNVTQHQHK